MPVPQTPRPDVAPAAVAVRPGDDAALVVPAAALAVSLVLWGALLGAVFSL